MTKSPLLTLLFTAILAALAPAAFATDTDSDGLSDTFEAAYGTDPNDADSDDDNLNDYGEVFIYGTDPNLADTDGDGTDDDTDTAPLEATGTDDGVNAPSFTSGLTSAPYAWSGESAQDGLGVYMHSGNFVYQLSVGQTKGLGIPFAFPLTYMSQMTWDGYAGKNIATILRMGYEVDGGTSDVTVYWLDGVDYTFTYNSGPGTYTSPDGWTGTFSEVATDEYEYTTPGGFTFSFSGGELDEMEDRFGNAVTLNRTAGEVTSIDDTRGETHTLTYWSGTGRLKKLAMADGRDWEFFYNVNGQLRQIDGPTTTTFGSGISHEFRYSSGSQTPTLNDNMIAAFDGVGQQWLRMTFDEQDRVVTQQVGTGSFSFDWTNQGSQQTTVTDRVGNERVWEWDATLLTRTKLKEKSNRNVRSGDPTEWVTEWDHDSDGYLTEVTLPRGNGIKYTLDSASKRATERRHKEDMGVADDDDDDIVHEWTLDSSKYYAASDYTDPRGNETSYTLNSDGQPTTVTFETITNPDPDVTITNTYTYNSDGTVDSFTDGEGKVTDYTYFTTGPRKGRVLEVFVDNGTGGLALKTTYDYEDWGDVKTVTDPEGNVTTYTVEAYGNVTKIAAPSALGYETKFTHDENLNVTKREIKNVDETGTALSTPSWWTTDYTYTIMDKVASIEEDITSSTTRTTELDYNANDLLTQWLRGDVEIDYEYDERDLLYERERDPHTLDSIVTETFTYDANRNLSEYENGRSKDTTHEYDLFDRRTKTINALGHYTQFVYDKAGNLTERKSYEEKSPSADELLAHHKRHYDEMNRFHGEEDVLLGTTDVWYSRTYVLDKRGLVTKATDRRSNDTDFEYDGARRRTKRTDEIGNIVEWTYDDNGNVTEVEETEKIPGSGSTEAYVTEFTYDEINRQKTRKVIDRTNGSNYKLTTWKRDSLNVIAEMLDPKNQKTTWSHDGLGRITEKRRELSGSNDIVTGWTYDIHDNVTQLEDDNGNTTDYAYDDLNRLIEKTYDDAEEVLYRYDAAHNVTQITDQNGSIIAQGFDDLDRLTEREITKGSGVVGDTDEDYTYDALNRLTEARDNDSIVQFTYDSLSRVLTEKQGDNPFGSSGKTVTYTWDAESNRTQIDYPSSFEAHRTYDAIDRLAEIEDDSSNSIAAFDLYGASGRRKEVTHGNGTTSSYTYDGFRRPTEIFHEDSGSSEFAGFDYGWDKNDNPLYEARSHQSGKGDVYTYDKADRLEKVLEDVDDPAAEVASPGTEAYIDKVEYNMDDVLNFDTVVTTPYGGSASTLDFANNGMNEYTDVGGTTHTYDDNGNLTDDGTYEYDYDWRNHLVKVTKKSDSSTVATYDYDCYGLGRRTEKVVGSDTTRFVYADQQCIEEYDGSDDLLRLFVFGDGLDEICMMEAPDVADVDDDANTTELKRFYYHTQLIGSVTHITDPDENVVESYDFGPYGDTVIKDIDETTVSASPIGNPWMFTGRRIDEETGLYYYRARHYSPGLGRFVQRDPLEYVDGPSLYPYVRCGPVAATDPSGLLSVFEQGQVAAYLAAMAEWWADGIMRGMGLDKERKGRDRSVRPEFDWTDRGQSSDPSTYEAVADLLQKGRAAFQKGADFLAGLGAGEAEAFASMWPSFMDNNFTRAFASTQLPLGSTVGEFGEAFGGDKNSPDGQAGQVAGLVAGGAEVVAGIVGGAAVASSRPGRTQSMWNGKNLKDVQTDVGAGEFISNLRSNGFSYKVYSKGTVVLEKGISRYAVYVRKSKGLPGAEYFRNGVSVLKYTLGVLNL